MYTQTHRIGHLSLISLDNKYRHGRVKSLEIQTPPSIFNFAVLLKHQEQLLH